MARNPDLAGKFGDAVTALIPGELKYVANLRRDSVLAISLGLIAGSDRTPSLTYFSRDKQAVNDILGLFIYGMCTRAAVTL
jgi:hypothetical protein